MANPFLFLESKLLLPDAVQMSEEDIVM